MMRTSTFAIALLAFAAIAPRPSAAQDYTAIVAATDRNGYAACDRVLGPENFVSTVYRKLGIDPNKVLYTPEGRPTHIVSDPTPIQNALSRGPTASDTFKCTGSPTNSLYKASVMRAPALA